MLSPRPDLHAIFDRLNQLHFDGFLEPPVLAWNSRLSSSAGRFIPGSRKYFQVHKPKIEVALYLMELEGRDAHIADTMAHEMIHYWLWVRGRPYGHTGEFLVKMRLIGTSRYNPVPKKRPFRYVYRCAFCLHEFPTRKKIGVLACAKCCKQHSGGKFDTRFMLVFDRFWSEPLA